MTPHAWIWLTPPLTNKCRRRVCSFFVCYVCFVWTLDHLDMNTFESRSYAPLRTRDSPIRVYIASFYFCSLLPEKDPSQVLFLQRAPSIPCGTYSTISCQGFFLLLDTRRQWWACFRFEFAPGDISPQNTEKKVFSLIPFKTKLSSGSIKLSLRCVWLFNAFSGVRFLWSF